MSDQTTLEVVLSSESTVGNPIVETVTVLGTVPIGPRGIDGVGGGSGVTDATYLVATAHADLSDEVVVGATPGGELGGTWASPTVDATHSGSSHASVQAAAEATAAADATTKANAAQAAAVQRANHTGTQSADTLTDGTTNKAFLATERTKLAGIETAATADQTAAEILAALLTVDGAGSGLDADLLDGQSSAAFETPAGAQAKADAKVTQTITNGVTTTAPSEDAVFDALALKQPLDADLTALAAAGNSATLAATTASFLTADETKLDGIEAGAEVNDTAAEILTKLLTVDGAGSGLDADLLDGNSSATFATAAALTAHIDDTTDAHDASAISVADAGGHYTGDDVEEVLAEIATDAIVIEDLAAADQTERSWTLLASQSGTYVKVESDVVTRPSRVRAPLDRTAGFTDCYAGLGLNAVNNSEVGGDTPLALQTSGTTAGVSGTVLGTNEPGVIAFTTGSTSSTGYAAGLLPFLLSYDQSKTYLAAFRAKIPTVTTTGQTFDTYIGLRSAWDTNAVNDGIYFHAKSGNSAGNWFAVCEDDTTTTSSDIDTGTAVDTSWHTFVIHYNGTDAKFYIDDVLEATISTNRPDTGATLLLGAGIYKTAGTTARTLQLDAMEWDLQHTTRGDLMGLLSL